jgi:TolB-like protein/Flp pilus assembly protein TadD
MDLLMLLVQRRGEVVGRDEIVQRRWGSDVFIDADASVNTVVRKVRRALRDSAGRSRLVETVQGRGYRFVASVEPISTHAVVAVLPFGNFRGDREQDYIADGLTEETSVELARADPERISVIGRRTSLAYRGTAKTVGEIGRELGADYIVEGSVRGAAGRVRISVTLTRVADQVQIWTETYDRDAGNLLGVQAELGADIAEHIRATLSPLRVVPPRSARDTRADYAETKSADAFDLYLRGRYYYNQMTASTAERALECFRSAASLDPMFARAWAGIADTYSSRLFHSDTPSSSVAGEARRAAAEAVKAGPAVADAQTAQARVRFLFDWDWRGAEAHLRRAIALDHTSVQSHWLLGFALSHQGRHADALAAASRAIELDPVNALSHSMAAQIAFSARQMEAAAMHAQQALLAEPDFWVAHWQLGQAYEQLGRTEEVLTVLADASRLSNGNSKPASLSAYVLSKIGRVAEARGIIERLEQRSRAQYVPPVMLALPYVAFDHARVFDALAEAVAQHDVHLIYLPFDPKWDAVRRDARFTDVLKRCGLSDRARRRPTAAASAIRRPAR